MSERFKDFVGRHVFHPFLGMTLGTWWTFLRRHRFAIDLQHLPRALVQTSISASNRNSRMKPNTCRRMSSMSYSKGLSTLRSDQGIRSGSFAAARPLLYR